jgi:hypothetical protein
MDLFSIAGTFWRHKIVAAPVILLTLLGAFYIVKVKAPTYQATSSFLLSNPPGPPTAPEIAADPKLGKINPNNPYANYGNLAIAATVLVTLVSTPAAQQALVQEGADPRYQITPNTQFGFAAPVIQITGIASTAQEAIRSADLVTAKAESELHQMQVSQGVNSRYMIKALPLSMPQQARQSASGKLRTLIAVLGLGAILLFVAISAADAIDRRRRDRPSNSERPTRTRHEETVPGPEGPEGNAGLKMTPTPYRSRQRSARR